MGYRFTDFPHLLHRAPDELVETILGAVRENGGNVSDAAEYVGLTRRQFYKYAKAVGVLDKIQEIRDEFRLGRAPRASALDNTEFGMLARTSPDEAMNVMKNAYADSDSAPEAAENLGISAKRFYAYCRRWNLFPELQREVAQRTKARQEWKERRSAAAG